MKYPALKIANMFLRLAAIDRRNISPMKLQKLLYLAQGYCLVETGEPLVDELFEAWKFGPVLPSLYHACKSFGGNSVHGQLGDSYGLENSPANLEQRHSKIKEIIQFVWETYGDMQAIELSNWTHEKGGPWDKVVHSPDYHFRNQAIPNDLIKTYFTERMTEECSDEKA
jgi:uncharacterized phage-associated protein